MNLKARLVELLEYAYTQEQLLVQNLSDEERLAQGTATQWSAKDMIAHIAAWKDRAAQILAAVISGTPVPDFDGPDQFNAQVFEQHHSLTWSEVLDLSSQAYLFLREQMETASEDRLTTPELPEPDSKPVWWWVVGTGCSHPIGHLTEFYVERGDIPLATRIQEEAANLLLQLDRGPDWRVHYGLAGHYASTGQMDKAIEALRKASRLNPESVEHSKGDQRLASLREQPEYRRLCREVELLGTFEAVIFDMDGVIVDSEPLQLQSYNQILRPYGVHLSEDDFMRFVGSTQIEILTAIKKESGISEDTHKLIQRKKEAYLALAEAKMEAMPGLYELIDWLEGLGMRIGLASSSPIEDIQAILGYIDLADHFAAVMSSVGLAHGKPHPEVFLLTAQELGVDPRRCVVLEDSGRGVEAAKRASMVCIAMPNRFTEHQDFSSAYSIEGDLFEVKAALEDLLQSPNLTA